MKTKTLKEKIRETLADSWLHIAKGDDYVQVDYDSRSTDKLHSLFVTTMEEMVGENRKQPTYGDLEKVAVEGGRVTDATNMAADIGYNQRGDEIRSRIKQLK